MTDHFECRSPIDGRVVATRPLADEAAISRALDAARRAQRVWAATSLAERIAISERFCEAMLAQRDAIAREITLQMGRPIRYTPFEVDRTLERARAMASLAPEALADVIPPQTPGFRRYVRREPLGVVFVLAPWNYPMLTAVNAVVPAVLAGNAVVLKHATQTPLCAERFAEAFARAGAPDGLVQALHLDHAAVDRTIRRGAVDFVSFTGSVEGGRAVSRAAAERFLGTNLELGGKDPGYVRADADLDAAVDGLVDGAFFNSGQSCCGIERIYVHRSLFDAFVERAVALTLQYRLGDPLDPETTLGPLVRADAAAFVQGQIDDAVAAGARALVDSARFPAHRAGSAYLAPQILVDVRDDMRVMREESFGPVVGIARVDDDDEAVRRMNDSDFGLTAAIYSRDVEAAERIATRLETGTVFLNRCDYLDPWLAWTGVKDSGRGCSLSRLGFDALVRPKSRHLRLPS